MVFGGTRSGKSVFAEKLCIEASEKVLYLATAIPLDDGMKARIKKHQNQRPSHWETIECYHSFHLLSTQKAFINADVVILDCITVMITNLMFENPVDMDTLKQVEIEAMELRILNEIQEMLAWMRRENKMFVLVSSEVGMGLVAPYKSGNIFRDIVGKANQLIAAASDEVHFVIAGIPMKIK